MENAAEAWPWALVVIGGPLLLGGLLALIKIRSARTADKDPGTPSSDPSKGMTGHD